MPAPFDPGVVFLVGVIGGIFAAGTYVLYKWADEEGGKIKIFPEPPPFPRLPEPRLPEMGGVFGKPGLKPLDEVIGEIRRGRRVRIPE